MTFASAAFELYQDRGFVEILAAHRGIDVVDTNGLLLMLRRVPLVGYLGGFLGGPERHRPFEGWWPDVRGLGFTHLMIRTSVELPPLDRFRVSPADNVGMCFDLGLGEAELRRRIQKKTRQTIRYSSEQGVAVRPVETEQELESLYRLCVVGSQHGRLFELPALGLVRELFRSPYGQGFLAHWQGRAVAGCFCLLGKGMHAWIAGIDPEHRHLDVGAHVQYDAMRWGIARGFAFYEMGDQSLSENPALTSFKMRFRPELTPAYHYRVLGSGPKAFLAGVLKRGSGRG